MKGKKIISAITSYPEASEGGNVNFPAQNVWYILPPKIISSFHFLVIVASNFSWLNSVGKYSIFQVDNRVVTTMVNVYFLATLMILQGFLFLHGRWDFLVIVCFRKLSVRIHVKT